MDWFVLTSDSQTLPILLSEYNRWDGLSSKKDLFILVSEATYHRTISFINVLFSFLYNQLKSVRYLPVSFCI